MSAQTSISELNRVPAAPPAATTDGALLVPTARRPLEERRKSYLETLGQIVSYVDSLRRVLEGVYDGSFTGAWGSACNEAHFVARRISEDAVRAVKALAIALLPSQWHHIDSYLDYRYSVENTRPARHDFKSRVSN